MRVWALTGALLLAIAEPGATFFGTGPGYNMGAARARSASLYPASAAPALCLRGNPARRHERRRAAAAGPISMEAGAATGAFDAAAYIGYLQDTAGVDADSMPDATRLALAAEILVSRGLKPVAPSARKGVHPFVVPIATDEKTGRTTGLLRQPLKVGTELQLVESSDRCLSLLADSVDKFIKRAAIELAFSEDATGTAIVEKAVALGFQVDEGCAQAKKLGLQRALLVEEIAGMRRLLLASQLAVPASCKRPVNVVGVPEGPAPENFVPKVLIGDPAAVEAWKKVVEAFTSRQGTPGGDLGRGLNATTHPWGLGWGENGADLAVAVGAEGQQQLSAAGREAGRVAARPSTAAAKQPARDESQNGERGPTGGRGRAA